MNIAFWTNALCERGTAVALFDYAYYNQVLLHNTSFVFYDKHESETKPEIIEKFQKQFTIHETDGFNEVDEYIKKYNITHIYIIKAGCIDDRISKIAKNCIHCVFTCRESHGDVYSAIAPWVEGNAGKYPVVPHMIDLPRHDHNMRLELHIPENAIVFGGYGGKDNFSIQFAQVAVYNIALHNPHIFFLFANFDRFCDPLPNILHLPAITDLAEKTRFINTTDAMLWARADGEIMSMAMGEFSILNKPIICMNVGYSGHFDILGENAFWYDDLPSLCKILLNFNPETERKKDWNAYKEYTPENVMRIFQDVYLCH